MNLSSLLTDLEQGHTSVQQAIEIMRAEMEDVNTHQSVPTEYLEWFQTGVDCVMIRFELKEFNFENV